MSPEHGALWAIPRRVRGIELRRLQSQKYGGGVNSHPGLNLKNGAHGRGVDLEMGMAQTFSELGQAAGFSLWFHLYLGAILGFHFFEPRPYGSRSTLPILSKDPSWYSQIEHFGTFLSHSQKVGWYLQGNVWGGSYSKGNWVCRFSGFRLPKRCHFGIPLF